jgi:hypothetical protein
MQCALSNISVKGKKTRNNLIAFTGPLNADIVAKVLLVRKRKFLQSPMRFARADVRDNTVSPKIDD